MNNFSNMDNSNYQQALAEQSQEYSSRGQSIAEQQNDNNNNNNTITTAITEPLGAELIKTGVTNLKTYVKGGVKKVIGKGVKKVASKLGVNEEDVDSLLKGDTSKLTKSLVNKGSKVLQNLKADVGKKVSTVAQDLKDIKPSLTSAFDGGKDLTSVSNVFKQSAGQDPNTLLDDDDDNSPLSLQTPKTISQESKVQDEQSGEEASSKASVKAQEEKEGGGGKDDEDEEEDEDDLDDLDGVETGADVGAEAEGGLNPVADLLALGLGIFTAVEGAETGDKKPIIAPAVSSASTQFGV